MLNRSAEVKERIEELRKGVCPSWVGIEDSLAMGPPKGGWPHDDLVKIVNESRQSVLEIGSRVVGPFEINIRALFPNASSHTGFDYYSDSNTDVVGDAHSLSHYFPSKRFGAILALSSLSI